MDPSTVAHVQQSWAKVQPIADAAGKLFYANLFEADPQLRALFKGDLDQQATKLMQMIDAAVGQLGRPETLLPALESLGRRHVGYGVQHEHYATVGAALLKTLKQGLGPGFTPQVEAAWTAVYAVMVGVMTG